jgi:hypothetical protein
MLACDCERRGLEVRADLEVEVMVEMRHGCLRSGQEDKEWKEGEKK